MRHITEVDQIVRNMMKCQCECEYLLTPLGFSSDL